MRCAFCFSNNDKSRENCQLCGSPLCGLAPPETAPTSSTRLPRTAPQLPENATSSASKTALPKPKTTRQHLPIATERKTSKPPPKTSPLQNTTSQSSELQNAKRQSSQLQTPQLQLVAQLKFDGIVNAAFWATNQIAVVSRDAQIVLWNASRDETQTLFSPPKPNDSRCLLAAFDALHNRVVLAFEDGGIELVSTRNPISSTRLRANGATALALALSQESEILAVASQDGTLCLWDLAFPQRAPNTIDSGEMRRALAISGDARSVATGNESGQVAVWNRRSLETGARAQWSFAAHRLWVSALAFSPNAQMLASGGYDGTVRLFAVQNGFETARFPAENQSSNEGQVAALCFLDNRFLAIGWASGTLWLLDSWTGTTASFALLSAAPKHLAASRDGEFLVASCGDKVQLFRLSLS